MLTVTYIIVRLVFIVIFIILVFFLIIFVLKISFFHIIIQLLELKSFTSEPVNSAGDKLLLDIFTQLVIEFKTFLNIRGSIIIILIRRWRRGREEVEE